MTETLDLLRDIVATVARRRDRARQRRALREMSDDQLRDIGLTRRQARDEGGRPFWSGTGNDGSRGHRLPGSWCRRQPA